MSKEYERIRVEIHKRYKDEISELLSTIRTLEGRVAELEEQNKDLTKKLLVANHPVTHHPNPNFDATYMIRELYNSYSDAIAHSERESM